MPDAYFLHQESTWNIRYGNISIVTFVTTFGIAKGMHNSVVHSEVRMEDLFER